MPRDNHPCEQWSEIDVEDDTIEWCKEYQCQCYCCADKRDCRHRQWIEPEQVEDR